MNIPTTTTEPAASSQDVCDVLVIGGNIRDLEPIAGENIVEAQ